MEFKTSPSAETKSCGEEGDALLRAGDGLQRNDPEAFKVDGDVANPTKSSLANGNGPLSSEQLSVLQSGLTRTISVEDVSAYRPSEFDDSKTQRAPGDSIISNASSASTILAGEVHDRHSTLSTDIGAPGKTLAADEQNKGNKGDSPIIEPELQNGSHNATGNLSTREGGDRVTEQSGSRISTEPDSDSKSRTSDKPDWGYTCGQ